MEDKEVEFAIGQLKQKVMDTDDQLAGAGYRCTDSTDCMDKVINKSNINAEESTTNLKLHEDIFTYFFLINYTRQYSQLSCVCKIVWWFGIIITFLVQISSLYLLTISYSISWEINYDINSTIIFHQNWLHSLCLFSSAFILYFYLLQSSKPFINLYSFCLCYRDSLTKLTYNYGVIISCLNLGIVLITWYASLIVSFSGVYGTIDNPAEIVLASLSFVFILEVDDYICSFFLPDTEQTDQENDTAAVEFSVKVNLQQFDKSSKYGKIFVSVLLIDVLIFMIYSAADQFQNETDATAEWKIDEYLQRYLALIAFMIIIAIRAIYKSKDLIKQRLYDRIFFFIYMVIIICISCFGISMFDGTGNKMQTLQPQILISIIIGCINYVLLIIFMLMEFKDIYTKFKNIIFWIIIVLCISVIIMWRIKSGELSESGIAIIVFGIGILYKFYLSDVSIYMLL